MDLIQILIWIVVIGLVCGLAWRALDLFGAPEPINQFLRFAVIAVGVIAIIYILLAMVGGLPRLGRIG